MITVGVDLAADARNTAVAILDWSAGPPVVRDLRCPADDATVLAACVGAQRIGIDCPLGWPIAFVEFVTRHNAGRVRATDGAQDGWRRPLVNRVTDLACIEYTREQTGRAVRPLSVSADLLGHTAMRCAVLLAALDDAGTAIDRSGVSGQVAEVYPAACLSLWGVTARGYKGRAGESSLAGIATELTARLGLAFAADVDSARLRTSDHLFDAVVAAAGARAVALGRATRPTRAQLATARVEGWIALPTCTPQELTTGPN